MFEKRPLLEELFLHYFRIPEEEEVCEPLSAPEILMTISKQSKIDLTETKLRLFGQLMQKYNVRKKMKKTGNTIMSYRKQKNRVPMCRSGEYIDICIDTNIDT